MIGFPLIHDVAVVPVFVNAGAALLPAIMAGLATCAALLLRPRQLVRACIRKPLWLIGIVAVSAAAWFTIIWIHNRPAPAELSQPIDARIMSSDDWVQLARRLAAARTDPSTGSASAHTAKQTSFRGNNARSGYMGGHSPTNLVEQWSYTEKHAMFWSSPLVWSNRVYAAWCLLDPPASYGAVVCLDAQTGQKLWETDMKDESREFVGFFSSPVLSEDGRSLVIGQGLHPDFDTDLVCLDTASGAVRWLVACPLHIEGSPAVAGNIAVAGAGAIEDPSTHLPMAHSDPVKDKNPGYVLAADLGSGDVLWQHTVNDPESSPAVEDGVVYIGSGFNGNAIVALRLSETDEQLKAAGKQREIWRTVTPFPATGAITLAGDLVLAGCGNGDYVFQDPNPAGAVVALDKTTGEILWRHDLPDGVLGPVAVRGNVALAPVRNGLLVALDLEATDAASRVLWTVTPRKGARLLAGPAFTGRHVYVVTHDGFMVVLDGCSGGILQTIYINGKPGEMGMCISSPVVAGGRIYVGSETGGVRCYADGN